MENWKKLLSKSVTTAKSLSNLTGIDIDEIKKVIKTYPFKINPYYLSLIKKKKDPFWMQAIPDIDEFNDSLLDHDPLCEELQSPAILEQYGV